MTSDITHRVYFQSNEPFNTPLHDVFRLLSVGASKEEDRIARFAVDLARSRFGWNQSEFAEQIGVMPAHITNWLARRLPPERYTAVANKLRISVDDLVRCRAPTEVDLTQEKQRVEPKPPFPQDAEFQVLLSLWTGLDRAQRHEVLKSALGQLRRPSVRAGKKRPLVKGNQ